MGAMGGKGCEGRVGRTGRDDEVDADYCRKGHFTSPKEQKTQQSLALGRKTVWHLAHSWKNWHASVGISSFSEKPHWGHVSLELVVGCMRFSFPDARPGYSPGAG